MAVTADGEVVGSISGGCIEEDAVMLALQVLSTGVARTAHFGFTDDDAHAAGLACGGAIDVIAYPLSVDDDVAIGALESAMRDEAVAVGLVIAERSAAHGAHSEVRLREDGSEVVRLGRITQVSTDGPNAGVFTLSHSPRPRLVILGAGDYAAALSRVASISGFAVTVCDGWGLLVTPERFPDADQLVTALPHQYLQLEAERLDSRTAICVLTHDDRYDIPALREALRLKVAFVGALGARRTVTRRARLLREQGVTEGELARLHSPLGLDLGAETPEETAISILAEIVAARRAGTGAPLCGLTTPIHPGPRPARAHPNHNAVQQSCSIPRLEAQVVVARIDHNKTRVTRGADYARRVDEADKG
jgi:xanthine dehydrogenase accessory factor